MGDKTSPQRSFPMITFDIIALNVLIYILQMAGGESFFQSWSFVPSRFLADPLLNMPTIFTSMFMHAGVAHLFANMFYLWVFGDNVENEFGKIKFVLFYLFCGLAALGIQFAVNPHSTIPILGASGAIAGILGAYFFLWPKNKINLLTGGAIPVFLLIGFWFLLQFYSGIGSLSNAKEVGGVAYMAHVGGFVTGLLIAIVYSSLEYRKPS